MKSRKDEQFFLKHSSCRISVQDDCFRKSYSRKLCYKMYILLIFFIAYAFIGHVHVFAGRMKVAFKGHVHVFVGQVKVVSHSS